MANQKDEKVLMVMGNNPMVGATVAVAVAVEESQNNFWQNKLTSGRL